MKYAEISELSPEELKKKLRDTRNELVELRVRKQAGQIEKSSELRELRRDIARIETALSAKSQATA